MAARGGNSGRTPRRHRADDEETQSPYSPHNRSRSYAAPATPTGDRDPIMNPHQREQEPGISRKKSLIRPERNRIDRDHPNYHYRKHAHAQGMAVQPSTTGNDPIAEEELEAVRTSDGRDRRRYQGTSEEKSGFDDTPRREGTGKLRRKDPQTRADEEALRKQERDSLRPPSIWNVYCAIITFWAPNKILACFGMPSPLQQRAWREKMGLISLILSICTAVGYLTFGFTQTVCPPGAAQRMRVNTVDRGFMVFHGKAVDLSRSHHPLARGVPDGANVVFDLGWGGWDGSFLFQQVNGACKGLINKVEGSSVPSDSDGNLGWYFPCRPIKQDGSSEANNTTPLYNGFQCHTSKSSRQAFYALSTYGDVYYTWQDIKNSTRQLIVWGSDVIDLNLLTFFNTSQVTYPPEFDSIRKNTALYGLDTTRIFSSSKDKQIAQCMSQIAKVGTVDTATVGCIASRVVLYTSLGFILAIVGAKFVLALIFEWILCKRFNSSSEKDSSHRQRQQQIEEWSDDIYRPAPRLAEPPAYERNSNRGSRLFPRTSRFTSPYAMDGSLNKGLPTTMASQNTSNARLVPGASLYRQGNQSQGTLPSDGFTTFTRHTHGDSRSSVLDTEGPGPAGFVHESVVPQPPPEWQPYGYPLAHAICLVTAYSEGYDGIRTTLDSIATTDYPNSHKLILVICDGMIKGQGEKFTTPDICLRMMKDHYIPPQAVEAFSYVAVASGSKRHNKAKIYAGFYDYGRDSKIPNDKQVRVPMMVVVKCGTADEQTKSKPGNRGKRDSQIILMSFLQKVMFDERMTELEFEMFNGIWNITGMSPDFYEVILMVDADTKVFPDSLTHMISAMVKDPEIMGLCGETKIANKRETWVTMIQVFEYFISHHLSKSFESVFGGVTCLPGCFCMYRIKAPKGDKGYWVPILSNPDVVEHYSENVVDTLHKKNLLLLGEDRYLSTLMLKTFPKRKQVFVPQAVCKTTVPDKFSVLLSQRRRWINSTVHNLMELVLVRDLCGTFCFSMQFVVFIELVGTLVLPAAIAFTLYLIAISIKAAILHTDAPLIPLILLALILGLPAILIVITAHRVSYIGWMLIYILSLPVWNFILPTYAYWKFDDFSWGDTRKTDGDTKGHGYEAEGEFDSSKITMKRWNDFEQDRRNKGSGWSQQGSSQANYPAAAPQVHQREPSGGYFEPYYDNY
ncbi:chitin synthase [Trichodelitschia bisporula]|uniref:chitin synthase n=1 Tax=Trichodelitschia bisporula TaxID=703511 RepID=A0A6G1I6S7_9PEZI|nr:chitin synthase [Trichodelitschia bisporula]